MEKTYFVFINSGQKRNGYVLHIRRFSPYSKKLDLTSPQTWLIPTDFTCHFNVRLNKIASELKSHVIRFECMTAKCENYKLNSRLMFDIKKENAQIVYLWFWVIWFCSLSHFHSLVLLLIPFYVTAINPKW